jgi:uncharacterized Zn finger protein
MSGGPSTPRDDRSEGPKGRGRFPDRRAELPRKVRSGIRLRSKEAPRGRTWIARQWLRLLESEFRSDVLRDGLAYAHSGQTVGLEIRPGVLEAQVQGRAPKPYATTVRIATLTGEEWRLLIDAMAAEATHAARLLASDLSPSIQAAFASLGLELMPGEPGVLRCDCSCDEAGRCKHAAAVAYLIAEQLDEDPLVVFTLRGIRTQHLLDRLRQARTIHTHGVAATHADPMIPESREVVPLLEECVDEFWRPGPRFTEAREINPAPHVHHALLRRLGPSPMNGRFPLVGLLASIYDSVAEAAVRLRDQSEQAEEDGE